MLHFLFLCLLSLLFFSLFLDNGGKLLKDERHLYSSSFSRSAACLSRSSGGTYFCFSAFFVHLLLCYCLLEQSFNFPRPKFLLHLQFVTHLADHFPISFSIHFAIHLVLHLAIHLAIHLPILPLVIGGSFYCWYLFGTFCNLSRLARKQQSLWWPWNRLLVFCTLRRYATTGRKKTLVTRSKVQLVLLSYEQRVRFLNCFSVGTPSLICASTE